jgi:hypothetical protein
VRDGGEDLTFRLADRHADIDYAKMIGPDLNPLFRPSLEAGIVVAGQITEQRALHPAIFLFSHVSFDDPAVHVMAVRRI